MCVICMRVQIHTEVRGIGALGDKVRRLFTDWHGWYKINSNSFNLYPFKPLKDIRFETLKKLEEKSEKYFSMVCRTSE